MENVNSSQQTESLQKATETSKPNGNSLSSSNLQASQKALKSTEFFKATRIDSCTHVILKNGVAQAIPFVPAKKKEPEAKTIYTKSLSQYTSI